MEAFLREEKEIIARRCLPLPEYSYRGNCWIHSPLHLFVCFGLYPISNSQSSIVPTLSSAQTFTIYTYTNTHTWKLCTTRQNQTKPPIEQTNDRKKEKEEEEEEETRHPTPPKHQSNNISPYRIYRTKSLHHTVSRTSESNFNEPNSILGSPWFTASSSSDDDVGVFRGGSTCPLSSSRDHSCGVSSSSSSSSSFRWIGNIIIFTAILY